MKKLTPLLSDSIRDVLNAIYKNHESKIAEDLINADKYIEAYNKIIDTWGLIDTDREILCPILEDKINALITDEVRALSVRRDVFEVSFTPKGKELLYSINGNWSRENRQTGKPGRIFKKLLVYDYKERDIEIFSNLFKAELMNLGEWKIVEGSDICHWYNGDNYYKIAGTLGNSCMRYCECQDYFKVYEDNAKLLICVKNDTLLGRAILWEIDGKTYMDRVYVCLDYLEEQFIQYAMSNKWYIRVTQALLYDNADQYWLGPEDEYKSAICPELIIHLSKEYSMFPYMDSFRHFNHVEWTISTIADNGRIKLSNTDGYWQEDLHTIECCNCGSVHEYYGDEDDHNYIWSEYYNDYLCPDCATYNSWLDSYISYGEETVDVNCGGILVTIPKEIVSSSLINEPRFETRFPSDYFIKLDSGYYRFDMVIWDEEDGTYKVKDENN